jgi:hypothetical protein
MNFYFILAGLLSVVGMLVSGRLKSKFQQYSQVGLRSNMSGREVAATMLRHYGINDVQITMGNGFLTDHYNPLTRTVTLSPHVYEGRSIAAAAVAAHECGHAVQHARAYAWLQFRSAMVPVVNVTARAQQWLLLLGLMLMAQTGSATLLLITIIAFAITTAFAFVTLPVEFDASRRALVWLEESGVTRGGEYDGAKDALWWAAMTYVSAALSSLVILVYLILNFIGSRRD